MSARQTCAVGITEYLSKHKGFCGIFKMRYQDFLVNEIDEKDQVVHLMDMTCDSIYGGEDKDSVDVKQCSVLSEEEKEKLSEFAKNKEGCIFLEAGDSKERRTKIHRSVNWLYPELESQTVDHPDTKAKVIKVTRGTTGNRSQNRKHRMPRKSLCKFVLFKQNIGTMEAVNLIAKKLHLHKVSGFQYAGTKDKRAVTSQLVTAPVAAERLCGLNKLNSNIKLGNFSYCKTPLRLGALNGNHFSLVIRNVIGTNEDVAAAFKKFCTNGFINYFGLQRFGTSSVPTQDVGIAILKSHWQEVVNLLLQPKDDERDENRNAALMEYSKSGDAEAALNCLKGKRSIEGILLQGLKKFGKTQLLQAITTIPLNTRKIYVHAYQSYVWNKVVSKRIRECGAMPIAGDLVYMKTGKGVSVGDEDGSKNEEEPPQKKLCLEDIQSSDKSDDVRILTEADLGLFTLEDVLLPLPGHDVRYPENETKSWYREVMAEDGIDIDTHMVHKVRDFSLRGAYRNVIVRPARVEYDLLRYDDYTIQLLRDDMDKLNGVKKPTGTPEGKFRAVRVGFSLPSSSYATIALRELMKTDISLSALVKLNEEHGVRASESGTEENTRIDISVTTEK